VINVVVCSSEKTVLSQFVLFSKLKSLNLVKFLSFQTKDIFLEGDLEQNLIIDLSELNRTILEGDFEEYLNINILDIILKSRGYESIFFDMINRIDIYKNLSYLDRRTIYYKLLAYWLDFLNGEQIDLVFFTGIPHEVSDFALYIVCKYKETKTLMLIPVYQFNRWMINFDYYTPYNNKQFQIYYNEVNNLNLINFDNIYSNHLNPTKSIKIMESLSNDRNSTKSVKNSFGVVKIIYSIFKLLKGKSLIKNSKLILLSEINDNFNLRIFILRYVQFIQIYLTLNLETKSLQKEFNKYKKCVLEFDFKYIIFYLHYQPENSTTPMGGFFSDQELVISAIAANIPDDWRLVVKEHPAQLNNMSGYAYLGRSTGFYKRLSFNSKIILIDNKIDSHSLLKNASAVATITGSVGWEAFVLGKHVLLFGDVWYQDLLNVHRIENFEKLKYTLKFVTDSHSAVKMDLAKLKDTIYEIHKSSFVFNYSRNECEIMGIDWDEDDVKFKLDKLINFIINNFHTF
jgi:hypothetical protein